MLSLIRSDRSKWGFRCEHICQDVGHDFVLLVFFFVRVDCEVMGTYHHGMTSVRENL